MKGFKMDWSKQTVTITKAFAEEALIEDSSASKVLKQLQAVCPNLKIVARTHKPSKSRNEAKGLTYEKMERYICCFEDSAEVYGEFLKVKQLSLSQPNCYQFVKEWFLDTFPNYGEMPEFVDGKAFLHPGILRCSLDCTYNYLVLSQTHPWHSEMLQRCGKHLQSCSVVVLASSVFS